MIFQAIQDPFIKLSDASQSQESQKRMEVETGLEESVITSFHTTVLAILVGGSTTGKGGTYDWIKAYLKSYKVWSLTGASKGMSDLILSGVTNVQIQADGHRKQLMDDPDVNNLASSLLMDSSCFLDSSVTWVDKTYYEMVANTPYSYNNIWDMLIECLEHILKELHQAQVGVINAACYSHRFNVWGMLQAWQIQQCYLTNSFKDDPGLNDVSRVC